MKSQLEAIRHDCINYNLELNGFNGFELIVLRKHKKLVKQFSGKIELIVRQNPKVFTTVAAAISGESQDNKTTKQ